MSLAERILAELARSPRKAKALAQSLNVESTDVNRLLYGDLSPVVELGEGHVWRLRVGFQPALQDDAVARRCVRLLTYFSECVFLDSPGPELHGYDIARKLLVFSPPAGVVDGHRWSGPDGSPAIHVERTDAIRIGIGLVVKREPSRGGQTVLKCAPLLMSRVLNRPSLEAADSVLQEGWTINTTALRLAGHGSHSDALIEHAVELEKRIDIDQCRSVADIPALCDRLRSGSEAVGWIATPEADHPPAIEEIAGPTPIGVAWPCLFASPQSKITEGLLEELKSLKSTPSVAAQPSALRFAMGGAPVPRPTGTETPLIEPVPLNEEQRHAVRAALEEPWTVIQGPPGTGKSQVVTAILANAAWRGQRVLFASKNNAAVDVVVERLNALAPRAAVLRIGSQQAMSALEQQARTLLDGHSTQAEIAAFNEAEKALRFAQSAVDRCDAQLAESDRRSIEVAKCLEHADGSRGRLGSERFAAAAAIDPETLEASLEANETRWIRADRRRQGLLSRAFWFALEGRRLRSARAALEGLDRFAGGIDGSTAAIPGEEESREVDRAYGRIESVRALLPDVRVARAFAVVDGAFDGGLQIDAACEARDQAIAKVKEASLDLWRAWLRTMESRLPPGIRQSLGALCALLQEFRLTGNMPWSNYYDALEAAVQVLPLWATTSLSARKRLPLRAGCFDLVVIDEASQCDIASALPLLYRAKRAVIIGDGNQLSHITSIPPAQAIRLSETFQFTAEDHAWSYANASLLDRALSFPGDRVTRVALREHFRCHPDIVGYSNEAFYNGRLIVRTRRDRLRTMRSRPHLRWIEVSGRAYTREGTSLRNREEATAIASELDRLVAEDPAVQIGVCSPFRAQVELLREVVRQSTRLRERVDSEQILIDTVHRFQGNERDVMIFSPTLAAGATPSALGYLSRSRNIFNVAVTRARAHLLVVGDREACRSSGVEYLGRFVEYCERIAVGNGFGATVPGTRLNDVASLLARHGIPSSSGVTVDEYHFDCVVQGERGPFAVEIDTEAAARCADAAARRRDLARWERLKELGWNLVRIAPHELKMHPERVLKRVQAAMRG
jgi:hypothetical protein